MAGVLLPRYRWRFMGGSYLFSSFGGRTAGDTRGLAIKVDLPISLRKWSKSRMALQRRQR